MDDQNINNMFTFIVEYTINDTWKNRRVTAATADAAKDWVRRHVTGACNLRASKIAKNA